MEERAGACEEVGETGGEPLTVSLPLAGDGVDGHLAARRGHHPPASQLDLVDQTAALGEPLHHLASLQVVDIQTVIVPDIVNFVID